INILLTHHLIVKKPTIYDHYLIDDFETQADVVLLADYHPRQGLIESNGTLFVSPGAISRKKNTKSDRNRTPALALINIDDKTRKVDVKFKGLKCETDVFVDTDVDESDDEEIKFNVKELNELINEDLTGGDIQTMIKTFSQKINSDPEMLTFIMKELESIS
ncbi:MAG: hypothetical protein R6U08_09545, partial [Bacillota bacterium]